MNDLGHHHKNWVILYDALISPWHPVSLEYDSQLGVEFTEGTHWYNLCVKCATTHSPHECWEWRLQALNRQHIASKDFWATTYGLAYTSPWLRDQSPHQYLADTYSMRQQRPKNIVSSMRAKTMWHQRTVYAQEAVKFLSMIATIVSNTSVPAVVCLYLNVGPTKELRRATRTSP